MSPRIQYDLDLFRNLVKKDHTKKEVMAKMSIKYIATFNSLMMQLFEHDKKYYSLKDDSNKVVVPKVRKVTVGKNNNIVLSAKTLENSAFKAGDSFVVKDTKTKIILTLIDE